MILGILIFLIFLFFAALMYLNRMPALLALPAMAVAIAAAAGIPLTDILTTVVAEGSTRLNVAIVTVIFGAMLGQFVNKSGIAETMIKKAAELAGDRPFGVALILAVIVALLFTVLGGLGAVIMVATIVLPIMLSLGVPRILAGSIFLMGLSLGGILNLTNWQLYISVLGLKAETILGYALPLAALSLIITIIFLAVEIRQSGVTSLYSEKLPEAPPPFVPGYALLTPILPLLLVFGFAIYNLLVKPANPFDFPIITAMLIGLLYGMITTWRPGRDSVNLISRSVIEGIGSVAPAVALIMGIGMILNAVMHPQVSGVIAPLLVYLMPQSALHYIILFTILAPFTLYRGPLNIWGMGSGLVGLMLATKTLSPVAIMAALLAVGQIQGVCDPTNTHNIWIANFLSIDVQEILRKTILYMWVLAVLGLMLAGIRYF